jgi:hypothetical protein
MTDTRRQDAFDRAEAESKSTLYRKAVMRGKNPRLTPAEKPDAIAEPQAIFICPDCGHTCAASSHPTADLSDLAPQLDAITCEGCRRGDLKLSDEIGIQKSHRTFVHNAGNVDIPCTAKSREILDLLEGHLKRLSELPFQYPNGDIRRPLEPREIDLIAETLAKEKL